MSELEELSQGGAPLGWELSGYLEVELGGGPQRGIREATLQSSNFLQANRSQPAGEQWLQLLSLPKDDSKEQQLPLKRDASEIPCRPMGFDSSDVQIAIFWV